MQEHVVSEKALKNATIYAPFQTQEEKNVSIILQNVTCCISVNYDVYLITKQITLFNLFSWWMKTELQCGIRCVYINPYSFVPSIT